MLKRIEMSHFARAWIARAKILPLTAAALVCLITSGTAETQSQRSTRSQQAAPQQPLSEDQYVRRLETMVRAMTAARDRHLLKPTNAQLIDGAIRGMLAALDPDAELYQRADVIAIASKTARSAAVYDSGLHVRRIPAPPRRVSPGLRVASVTDGSSAARVGIAPGDIITHIDGQPAHEISRLELEGVHFSASAPGTVMVRLQARDESAAPIDVLLEREAATGSLSEVQHLPTGIIYGRVPRLTDETVRNLIRSLEDASRAPASSVRGLLLDLRDLPGRDYDAAVKLADALLEGGMITKRVTRQSDAAPKEHYAQPGSVMRSKPIAVLINGGTKGAAEVVATALQDNRRALIIGRTSAGQAVLRTLTPIDASGERGYVLMSTTRFDAPNGRALDRKGIEPDIKLPDTAPQACREIDSPSTDGAGLCQRRTAGDDLAFAAAIDHLTRAQIATGKP